MSPQHSILVTPKEEANWRESAYGRGEARSTKVPVLQPGAKAGAVTLEVQRRMLEVRKAGTNRRGLLRQKTKDIRRFICGSLEHKATGCEKGWTYKSGNESTLLSRDIYPQATEPATTARLTNNDTRGSSSGRL